MRGTPFRKLPDYVQRDYLARREMGQHLMRQARRRLLAEERHAREDQRVIEFHEVIAAGRHVHCYLGGYYIARLTDHGDHWTISIQNKPCGTAPTRAEAEEVVRMWVRCNSGAKP